MSAATAVGDAPNRPFIRRVAITAVGVSALTLVVYFVPQIRFAYALPSAAVTVSTLAAATGVVLAGLFFSRYRKSLRLSDLLIVVAFGTTAFLEIVLTIAPELDSALLDVAWWSRVVSRSLVAIALCFAAWMTDRRTKHRWSILETLAACAVWSAGIVLWMRAMSGSLPPVIHGVVKDSDTITAETSSGTLVRLFTVALLIGAVIGFTRQAVRRDDSLMGWMAVGTVILAASRVHFILYPSIVDDWLTTADLLRVASQLVFLFGAITAIVALWKRRVAVAAEQERRRVARELHDGLAQELAYLRTQSALVARGGEENEEMRRLADSAERALDEARMAITMLASGHRARVDRMLASVGREVEDRYGCPVDVDAAAIETDEATAWGVTRIVREAVLNAVRHGDPGRVEVRVARANGTIEALIEDDGRGIEDGDSATGFGLTSMKERAEELGGTCVVRSIPGSGTRVVVELPAA